MADNSTAVKDKPQNDTSADDDFMAKLAGGTQASKPKEKQPAEDDDHAFMEKLANKSPEKSDDPLYAQPKQPTPANPLIGYLSNVAKDVSEKATKLGDEVDKNPVVQGLDAFEGNVLKGSAHAMTLPLDVIAGLTHNKPVQFPIDRDPVLNQNSAAHPIAAGAGNLGGAAATMMADPLYATAAIGKVLAPIGAKAALEAPMLTKMAQAAMGSLPVSADMAIQQQAMDNKGKIDWMKAAQATAAYMAANAGMSGAGHLLGEQGKKLITAVSQQMEKAQQTAPLRQAASFQQAPTGQPGGIVADILNQMGQASRRVTVGNKVVEFTDPMDAAFYNANKSVGSKEGRKAWKTLQDAGISNDEIDTQAKLIKQGTHLMAKDEKNPSVTIPQGAAQKRAAAEEAAKQAEKDAKIQDKEK